MELSFTLQDIEGIADQLLETSLDPIPHYRLLREVLHLDPDDPTLVAARAQLDNSRWVQLLGTTQLNDGTWGRFHTQHSALKAAIVTTEKAIRLALDSGLDANSDILRRLFPRLMDYITGRASWTDYPEKHDNPDAWFLWVRHLSAAALAMIDPHNPALDEFWHIRARSVEAAFRDGSYDRAAEIASLVELMDCPMKSPVAIHYAPSLQVLTATHNRLPEHIERAMFEHVLNWPDGIYYLAREPMNDFPAIGTRPFYHWVREHQLLSGFPLWSEICTDALNWIWGQRGSDGLWDLGTKVSRRPNGAFPLSESWRPKENRKIDSTVELLALLRKGIG